VKTDGSIVSHQQNRTSRNPMNNLQELPKPYCIVEVCANGGTSYSLYTKEQLHEYANLIASDLVSDLKNHLLEESDSKKTHESIDFVKLLIVSDAVMNQYKLEQKKMWSIIEPTPIPNDIAVRMAKAFVDYFHQHIQPSQPVGP